MYNPNELPRRQKRYLAVAIIGLSLFTIVLAGYMLEGTHGLDVEIEVVDGADSTDIHRISELTLRVSNTGDRPITPAFTTLHDEHQTVSYWDITNGSDRLRPGESTVYQLRAPTAAATIPYTGSAVVAVSDLGTDRRQTTTVSFDRRSDTVVQNPTFNYWEKNPDSQFFQPFRWQTATSTPGDEAIDIRETDGGATFSVANVTRNDGPWAMAGLQQRSRFPASLTITATPETVVSEPSRHPPAATGIEIADGNKRVWIVFADVEQREQYYRDGEIQYIIVYIPAQPGERTEATVDIRELYDRYEWQPPEPHELRVDETTYRARTVNVLAFSAVYPDTSSQRASVEFHDVLADPLSEESATDLKDRSNPVADDPIRGSSPS